MPKISQWTAFYSFIPLFFGALSTPAIAFSLTPIGTFETGIFDESAAEIPAYDPLTKSLFVTNGESNQIDVLDLTNPSSPALKFSISLAGGVNSVAYSNNIIAAAVEADPAQDPGLIQFFSTDGTFLNQVTVGALPDMVTFTPDGTKLLVANEGEPSSDYNDDPEGSVSIISIPDFSVTTAGFSKFNGTVLDESIRIFGPGASVAQDLEPEYITVSKDSSTAWVSLQENNAFGILDIASGEFTQLVGLGFKDHSLPGNGLDPSDRDDGININTFDHLFGLYQPDAITSYLVGDKTYIVSANEGDARDYDGLQEEERVKDLVLDPDAFGDADELQEDEELGRLTVTTTLGDTDNDGDFDKLYAFGGRSFSIWDEDGNLVFDSGDDFEQIVAEILPDYFNANNDENDFDSRSDAKGPEPEGVTIGEIMGRTYAFIGLERVGGVMTYDVSDPFNPIFEGYFNNRNFAGDPEEGTAGDLGPEGLLFIGAEDSPNSNPLLVVTNEVSGSTTIYAIDPETEKVPEPTSSLGLLAMGILSWLGFKRKVFANR
ncbi:MAG: choice-of-anchor I family protein [Spirulinaceae cyanobacterium]